MIKSKIAKTLVLLEKENLSKYIPRTLKLSKRSLSSMLSQYKMVYVKPDLGMYGAGVMRVEKISDDLFQLQFETISHRYATIDLLYEGIKKHKNRGPYLIQQGIELLKHHDRRFDIRVMTQINPRGRWETTGVIGRLAHPSRIVTNYHSGGTPLAYDTLMATHLTRFKQQKHFEQLQKLGITVAHQLLTKYPKIKEVGLDIGLDSDHHPWILEVNTLPNPFIFRKLKDKSIFRKISRYASLYGRFEKRYCPKMAHKK